MELCVEDKHSFREANQAVDLLVCEVLLNKLNGVLLHLIPMPFIVI
uniref:Uncharacterized protein n=1 Tax=Nelumbo nucifera TaxID=4432 RepID=A0A822ZR93_NELNU|nr:TPA_asm: hypothetical protein HUJ06_002570 [Nelumbo nucifera]